MEPWIRPEDYDEGHVSADIGLGDPQQKVCRMIVSSRKGRVSILDAHYLIGTPSGVEHFVETHELGLFSVEEQEITFESAGFQVEHDEEGLMGRGLYVGVKER